LLHCLPCLPYHLKLLVTNGSDSERPLHVDPAYPRQASSSIFNWLSNWLDFMVRRVDVYSRYFSRLEEAGTSTISIIDNREKARSDPEDFSFAEGPCLVSPSRFNATLLSLSLPQLTRSFSRFSLVISREKSHHPR